MSAPALVVQTTYAELLERCSAAAFGEAFPSSGSFTPKVINDRRYWYFQMPSGQGRKQKYVGADTPELLERIARHKDFRADERERQSLVGALVRSFGFAGPLPPIGNVVAALAGAGVFRMGAVLVGTVAYQTYGPMLGSRLAASTLQTGDVDIARAQDVTIAVDDETQPLVNILKGVDESFRPVPHAADGRRVANYVADSGVRVDCLTPNVGPTEDIPKHLSALNTDAQPLRFLDYLLREPEPAVVLYRAGVLVRVPSPERYAIHKLIVSQRRKAGVAKQSKDLLQAGALLELLSESRPRSVISSWEEAYSRGPKWRTLLMDGLSAAPPRGRDFMLKLVNLKRSKLRSLELIFEARQPRYDFDRNVVIFRARDFGGDVSCEISGEALEDFFGADGIGSRECIGAFLSHRSTIERLALTKYLNWPIEEPGVVLIRTDDVERLSRET